VYSGDSVIVYATACPINSYVHTHTQWEGTALHAAADCGHVDVVELLLEGEADPDVQNEVVHTISLTWMISMVNIVTHITTFFIFSSIVLV